MSGVRRVVIEHVKPEIEDGDLPVKAVVGDEFAVSFDAFGDGHDLVSCAVLFRHEGESAWRRAAVEHVGNDAWRAAFEVTECGFYLYTVEGWVDRYRTWAHDVARRLEAGQEPGIELAVGAAMLEEAAAGAPPADRRELAALALRLRGGDAAAAVAPETTALVTRWLPPRDATRYARELRASVDRPRAAFSAWYKVFPRSAFVSRASAAVAPAGTLRHIREVVLPHAAGLGFDVLYLLPIHPVGTTERKGRNNTLVAGAGDPGSPYAIGSADGGHMSIAPELGTLADLHDLVAACRDHGMELALDIAFQCSPDHPWVREHPEWFRHRPDGSIRYAENPPKRYEDIYPFDMEGAASPALWDALRDVFTYWAAQGIRAFRVDNPHTKPFAFWDKTIAEVRRAYPETIFLAEAFTRPKVMYRLAKAGFTQSYTYFTWRTAKGELEQYLTELTATEAADFYRPNFWPNTPDILPFHLQNSGSGAFRMRAVLAATLSSNWGVYAPAFELLENVALAPGREEYLHSEKYELRTWDLDDPRSIAPFLARLNAIRRAHPALQRNEGLTFHPVDNEHLIAYSKARDGDAILCVVLLDQAFPQHGWTALDLSALGLADGASFAVRDLLDGARYVWSGPRNYVALTPDRPAHVFAVEAA